MDEILELQRKLAQVQEGSNINKLTDRIIVEIIDKLQQKTSLSLIYTLDGQEYLTPEFLEKQVYEQVLSKDRLNIIQLPQILNIGLEKIELRLDSVCTKYQDIYRLNDSLFTQNYLDAICEEINEDLQQKSHLLISEISIKYDFPNEYFKTFVLEKRLGTIIQGTIVQGEKLTTISYNQTVKAKIRGFLRACLRPLSIISIAKEFQLDEKMVLELIESLIRDEEIDGKVTGGSFTPNKFLKNQELIIRNFFKQNNYVEYEMLSKQLFVQKPKDLLKTYFKDDCIFLDTCCYNKAAINVMKEQFESMLQNEGYMDLQAVLPSTLSIEDIETLVNKYMSMENAELDENYLFAHEYLRTLSLKFRDKLVGFIYQTPAQAQQQPAPADKKKKGKAASSAKDSAGNKLFNKEDMMKTLIDLKVFEYSDRDEQFEEKLYNQLMPYVLRYYEEIKKELFENKKSSSMEAINDLQRKSEDLLMTIQVSSRSLKQLEGQKELDPEVCRESIRALAWFSFENILLFLSKKFCLTVPSEWLVSPEKDLLAQNFKGSQYFINKDAVKEFIDKFPTEVKKALKECLIALSDKSPDDYVAATLKNLDGYGIKGLLDKKNEKNFLYMHKYNFKEAIKQNEVDSKLVFFYTLQTLLLERNILFLLEFSASNCVLLGRILLTFVGMKEEGETVSELLEKLSVMITLDEKTEEYVKLKQSFVDQLDPLRKKIK